jgi:hypothetical protein
MQPPLQWLPAVKMLGRDTNHSSLSDAEIKKDGAVPPRPIHIHDGF